MAVFKDSSAGEIYLEAEAEAGKRAWTWSQSLPNSSLEVLGAQWIQIQTVSGPGELIQ